MYQINTQQYPVWALFSQDYLSIMVSSISSKHAFLQGGITVRKCYNCLKGDIVKALQCVKCSFHNNLLFHKLSSLSTIEDEGIYKIEGQKQADGNNEAEAWDTLILEDDDNNNSKPDDEMDIEQGGITCIHSEYTR